MAVSEVSMAAASSQFGALTAQKTDTTGTVAKKQDNKVETTGAVASLQPHSAHSVTSVNAIKDSYKNTLKNDVALFNTNFTTDANGHFDCKAA